MSRCTPAWAESLDGALNGHQSCAMMCRYRCRLLLAEVPKSLDRNAKLERRRQPWEAGEVHIARILGQQHKGQQHTEKKITRSQTEEQRGKKSSCPHSQGINQQSHERTRGRSSSGHSRTWETLNHSPYFPKLGPMHTPHRRGASSSSARIFGCRQVQGSPQVHDAARLASHRPAPLPPSRGYDFLSFWALLGRFQK